MVDKPSGEAALPVSTFDQRRRVVCPACDWRTPTDLDDVFDMWLVSRAAGPPHHITFGRYLDTMDPADPASPKFREPPEKGSNRLETASMRNARTSNRWNSFQDGPMQRRQRSRGRVSSSRAVSNGARHHRRTSLPTGRRLIPGSPKPAMLEPITPADRAGYKPAMTSAATILPTCDVEPA